MCVRKRKSLDDKGRANHLLTKLCELFITFNSAVSLKFCEEIVYAG